MDEHYSLDFTAARARLTFLTRQTQPTLIKKHREPVAILIPIPKRATWDTTDFPAHRRHAMRKLAHCLDLIFDPAD